MKTILFVYDQPNPDLWQDGLYAALQLLEENYAITYLNLATTEKPLTVTQNTAKPDFILGWGGFNSPVDNFIQVSQLWDGSIKKGLCLGGNAFPYRGQKYDVIFYETDWTNQWLFKTKEAPLPDLVHAFGYNSNLYYPEAGNLKFIDCLTVGAFADWKRQERILEKTGIRMAIGEIQKGNLTESMGIIGPLLTQGVIISDMIPPKKLGDLYRHSWTVYIPANTSGGGERAVLEGQACGCEVEVANDNPKLMELLGKQWDEKYYKEQLETGIELVLGI